MTHEAPVRIGDVFKRRNPEMPGLFVRTEVGRDQYGKVNARRTFDDVQVWINPEEMVLVLAGPIAEEIGELGETR